tara:strand:+ start:379 stop:651 length:273 start_codon:yes stop_codon:yes gene_type:complete
MADFTWLPMEELSDKLYVSPRTIYKLKASGVIKAGTCFYRIGQGQEKGRCIYCLEECRKALQAHTLDGTKKKGERYKKSMIRDLIAKEVK